MNPLLLPSLTFFIGANVGVLVMCALFVNSRKELERRDEIVRAWADNNRKFDAGRSYIFDKDGSLMKREPLWTYIGEPLESPAKPKIKLVKG